MRRSILVVALVMLAVIQAVPYGANHTNPPVRVEPPWDSERTLGNEPDRVGRCSDSERTADLVPKAVVEVVVADDVLA